MKILNPTPRFFLRTLFLTCGLAAVCQPGLAPAQPVPADRSSVRPVYDQWTNYLNPDYAYQVPIPPGVRAVTNPRKGGSCRFVSADGLLNLKVWGSELEPQPGDPLEAAWREAFNLRGRSIDFQRRSRTGFVLAGTNGDGSDFYEKVILGRGAVSGFNVSYPSRMAERFAPWVDEMEQGFGWDPRLLSPNAAPEAAEAPRGFFGGIRQYFTGEGQEDRPSPYFRRDRETDGPPPDRARSTPGPTTPEMTPHDPSRTRVDLTPPSPLPPAEAPTNGRLEPRTDSPGSGPGGVSPASPAPSAGGASVKPTPAKREDLPYGISIPGRKGYVYSPYTDNKQQVDVTDIPTGTKVKCPYTGKVFRVP